MKAASCHVWLLVSVDSTDSGWLANSAGSLLAVGPFCLAQQVVSSVWTAGMRHLHLQRELSCIVGSPWSISFPVLIPYFSPAWDFFFLALIFPRWKITALDLAWKSGVLGTSEKWASHADSHGVLSFILIVPFNQLLVWAQTVEEGWSAKPQTVVFFFL